MADAYDLCLPEGYRERLPRSWRPWLDQLPEQIGSYLERWELVVVGELPLSSSFVAPVERGDGRRCVLKLQPTEVPDIAGAARELHGLRLAGPAAVEVVEEDAEHGALLLERASPGTTLEEKAANGDDAATEILARTIRAYGRRLDDTACSHLRPFEEVAEAFERFDRGPHGDVARRKALGDPDARLRVLLGTDEGGTAIPTLRSARSTAERVLAELLADASDHYLLHGDLHHGNVLADDARGHVVIDPWGFYGDRHADVAAALQNPLPLVAGAADVDELLRRRLAIYAEVIELDTERLIAWSYVYSVIRTLWTLEGTGTISTEDAGVRTFTSLRQRL